ncbi:hypothetical protein V0R55_24760 [Pseudomonas soli]|uniref:DUF3077 domain-containing protein n=1 Tax=Pseudomonas soli TaxID=1306993 RepID=A0ABU7GWL6_9PSED|nr:hypothetical protein [Pseudomonas soli]MEE1883380.1 hypothetical protein [Pseudomonas soli]
MSLPIEYLSGSDCMSAALLPLFGLNVPPTLLAPLAEALAGICRQCELAGVERERAYAKGIITGQLSAKALTQAQADLLKVQVNQAAKWVRAHIKDEAPCAPTVGGAA